MNDTAPKYFGISETLRHKHPDAVRLILQSHAFSVRADKDIHSAQIWTKTDGLAFWIVRIETEGNDTPFHRRGRSRYHKNWLPSVIELNVFLHAYVDRMAVYDDDGRLLGYGRFDLDE
jgi:hypothetical protein